jgi:hypothetical protein
LEGGGGAEPFESCDVFCFFILKRKISILSVLQLTFSTETEMRKSSTVLAISDNKRRCLAKGETTFSEVSLVSYNSKNNPLERIDSSHHGFLSSSIQAF